MENCAERGLRSFVEDRLLDATSILWTVKRELDTNAAPNWRRYELEKIQAEQTAVSAVLTEVLNKIDSLAEPGSQTT